MMNIGKKRLRRTMMFLNAQKSGLIKDPYIYRLDSVMLDLEDTVAKNQKDAARLSLCHTPKTIDYRGCERVVYTNGLDTPYRKKDIRCAVAGGCDAIRTLKTERPEDVGTAEGRIGAAEREFGILEGYTLIMAAIEPVKGVMKTLDICEVSGRLFNIALSDGNYTKNLQTHITGTGIELMSARQNMIVATRAVGVQCLGTVYTNLDNMEGFRKDVEIIRLMRFDGKSITNPRQMTIVHEVFTPTSKNIIFAEKVMKEIDNKKARGIGVFMVDGKAIDIAFHDDARRIIVLAETPGAYKGGS